MFVNHLLGGLVIGLPLMLAVGPIAILLLDQGLERGARAALPAAFGVASADLCFSVLAAVAGTSIAVFLTPITPWLSLAAVVLLLGLATRLARSAVSELRVLRSAAGPPVPALAAAGPNEAPSQLVSGSLPVGAVPDGAVTVLDRSVTAPDGPVTAPDGPVTAPDGPVTATQDEVASIPFGHLGGLRLGAAFYGLTLVNPLTVVLFAAVVVAGGDTVGTPGWAIGMALASLLVHAGWVLVGGALGATIGPVATARLRLAASALMAGLAVHFVLG
jgi:threonine/homoserine/homoserine lactone efflux protein